MIAAIRNILKDSVVYGIANIILKLTPLIIIPIITTYLDKTAFKVYDIAFMYTYLCASLVILGLDVAASVFYFDNQTQYSDKKSILTYSLFVQLFVAVLCFSVFYPIRYKIAQYIFGNDPIVQQYWLLALLLIPGHILLHYGMSVLMWMRRKKSYLLVCILQTVLVVGGVYTIVILWGKGIREVFYLVIGATSFCGLVVMLLIRKETFRNPFPLDMRLIRKLFLFGVPFGLTAFFRQLIPSIDRFFLIRYHHISELPEYLLAAKVGGLLSIASTAFLLAFTPYSLNKINQEDAEQEISELFGFISILAFTTIPLILIFKKWLILFFADASYGSSASLFPFFFFGWIFDLFTHFTMLGIYKSKKSFLILGMLVIGNLIISFLHMLLIPLWGIYGAAFSFTITKILLFFITLVYLKRYFHLYIDYRAFLPFFIVAVVLSTIGYYVPLSYYILITALFTLLVLFHLKRVFPAYKLRSFFLRT